MSKKMKPTVAEVCPICGKIPAYSKAPLKSVRGGYGSRFSRGVGWKRWHKDQRCWHPKAWRQRFETRSELSGSSPKKHPRKARRKPRDRRYVR